jgi:3'(2'), 5'-bisphosphate nucleotidase
MSTLISKSQINAIILCLKDTGDEVMKLYRRHLEGDKIKLHLKENLSPVTEADLLAHKHLFEGLTKISPLPIISEEAIPLNLTGENFWLIDPIDGTKEFIAKTNHFTLNIALVVQGEPILGFIYAPAMEEFYWGGKAYGAYKISLDHLESSPLIKRLSSEGSINIAISRSASLESLNNFLSPLSNYRLIKIGSSIKFCYVASGKVDLYPRLGATYEWDTAAGQAILESAGGEVQQIKGGRLKYGKTNYLNDAFVACHSSMPYLIKHDSITP